MGISRRVVASAALCAVLVGCAQHAQPVPGAVSYHGVAGDMLGRYGHVGYDLGCGDETLIFNHVTYYPFSPSNPEELPADPLAAYRPSTLATDDALGHDALEQDAESGDDGQTGMLVVYEGGLAYWEAEDGSQHTWFTVDEIDYAWEC